MSDDLFRALGLIACFAVCWSCLSLLYVLRHYPNGIPGFKIHWRR